MNVKIIIFDYITIQENFLTIPTLKTQLEQSYKYLNESCKYSYRSKEHIIMHSLFQFS
jgi:hypothetical protein